MRRLITTGFICIIVMMAICTLCIVNTIEDMTNVLTKDETVPAITYEQQAPQADKMSYMTYDELMKFDAMIYEIYLEEYCTNYCEKCDSYYYKECMCEACSTDCPDCLSYDYELYFVMDYYDMIMDEYEEVLRGIVDNRNNTKVEIKINEL